MTSKKRNGLTLFLPIVLTFFVCSCKKEVDDSKYSGSLFNENIRSTEPQTAEDERLGFKLPPGFEIQLFASEPNIDKPINMTFDAKGRIWVTQSFEYPFPNAPGEHGTDRLTILEDTDHDGIADKFTEVSDTLNIPVGVLPLVDGVLTFSVPNLYKFTDVNGDSKPEDKKVLIGPFGYQDTHGMVSNFIRGYDGWVYACHGFTNFSKIAGADGDSITLVSGNTFRFRLDGSRVEQMTFGQVNPFGLAFDEKGYIYSTDSHSSPLYQLIRGGDYPHFSKPEIMAFGPDMKSFENEATALCGIAYYGDTKFPEEFQRNFFIGDAVSSKVHRYSWENKGSSPVGKSEIDFVKSADPWFRPVNIKLGPDGAIYIADFYNAIIGHYEVPLGHPKRDKERGRIWRITYKGEHNDLKDLSTAPLEDLLNALDVDNIISRMASADQLADRIGSSAVEPLTSLLSNEKTTPRKYIHALWLLHRLNAVSEGILKKSIVHTSPQIRLHTLRILREWKLSAETFHPMILAALKDGDPHVQRAAVELLMDYPDMSTVESTLSVLNSALPTDTHLMYTSRLCLRNVMRNSILMKEVGAKEWSEKDAGFIAGTLVDVASADAAIFLANYLTSNSMQKGKTQLAYQQVARFIPAAQLESVISHAKEKKSTDIDINTQIFKGIKDGLDQRDVKSKQLESWAAEIAEGLLKKYPVDYDSASDDIISQQSFAIQLAGDFKVRSTEGALKAFIEKPNNNIDLKSTALSSLMKLSASTTIELAGKILTNEATPVDFKKRVASILGESPGTSVNAVLMNVKKAPADLEAFIVTALAHSTAGKDIVLKQVRDGSFMTRTLIDPRVEESMLANISPKQKKEYDDITANIEPINKDRQTLIDKRLAAFKTFKATDVALDSGSVVFYANCNVCHRKYTMSGIGPQLHGIGKRGPEALAEKILDPNRNISEAFRNYTVTLKDGKVLTGLFRRDEGAVTIYCDLSGKEFSIPKKNIATQTPSRYTIMPDHFGTTLSQREFNLLVNYLLTW
ncbi:MAG: PVC-type heme-binding CxxCH protein [Bacteroidota bacterium]